MFTFVTTTPQALGCTPCECGVPGACLQERLPFFLQFIPPSVVYLSLTFLIPLLSVLITSLLARWALTQILRNVNAAITNFLAVFIGSLFVWRIIFGYFQPNVLTKVTPLAASVVSVVLVYTLFTILDLRKKRTSILHSIFGVLIVLGLISIATFTVRHTRFSQYNQIVESKRESVVDVLEPLGLLEKSDEVIELLKARNYIALGNYISPSKKIKINFRDYDGVNFNKGEFLNVVQNDQLTEVNVYKKSNDFTITAEELLNVVSELLSSKYKTSYYIDNHNYADEDKELVDYSEADFLYQLDGKTTTLTFTKETITNNWYLSTIKYFDWDYPGY